MSEIGIIAKAAQDNNLLTIEFEAKGACKNCGICIVGSDKSTMRMQVQAKNTIKAKVGDKVEFEINEEATLKASFLLYGFPLGMFLLGFVLGQKIAALLVWSQDVLGLLTGAVFFVGAFYFLNKLEQKNKAGELSHIELIRVL
ncbi:SoxR reducing system RseC family protein [Candidatus Margulisiibacteriota bacterium]